MKQCSKCKKKVSNAHWYAKEKICSRCYSIIYQNKYVKYFTLNYRCQLIQSRLDKLMTITKKQISDLYKRNSRLEERIKLLEGAERYPKIRSK